MRPFSPEATAEIQSAVSFAEASPFPPDEDIVNDVFVGVERPQL